MKPLFLYLRSQKMSARALSDLVEAGYVPMPVTSFDAVKVLEPIPQATSDIVTKAALITIKGCGIGDQSRFGERVANLILEAGKEPKQ